MIQARMKSTRLPGKVLLKLDEHNSVLSLCVKRANQSKLASSLVVVTTEDPMDDRIIELCNELGIGSFRGSEEDVLGRYYNAAREFKADVIVRITSDCPFIDPEEIDKAISRMLEQNAEYFCNQEPNRLPDGMDLDVFTWKILERAHNEATSKYDREHVTPYIKRIAKKTTSLGMSEDFSFMRLTVDEPEDLVLVREICTIVSNPESVSMTELIKLLSNNSSLSKINCHIRNNEGSTMNTGAKIYKRAKRVIPGGNMLLSKRPEMFLQEGWPTYYSHAKGCEIWDLDENKYLDMSIMGIGTNTLGYAYQPVDEAVKKIIDSSNMSTFNCPEEVYLAETLIELHPWANCAKFARTGGEINAIAIRIARAASGRKEVAICGYHGWHDWYLSANLTNTSNLNDHLLPGLNPAGVPSELAGLTHAIRYNSFDDLEILDQNPNIGVLIMEVMRSTDPLPGYLEAIRNKCSKNNIVLIFDECTSGFRETYGGLHLKFGITPDLATFGKALGNGFAITAVIGREAVMNYANETFVSSTFWSERIGYVAGLATLKEMKRLKSWETITKTGNKMREIWSERFNHAGIEVDITGIPALSTFNVKSPNGNLIKTLITQEMLKNGILASNIFYPSIAHTEVELIHYEGHLNKVLNVIKNSRKLEDLLESKEAQTGFKRLN